MKRKITVSLESDLADAIDESRGDISRSRFIGRLLLGAMDEERELMEVRGYA